LIEDQRGGECKKRKELNTGMVFPHEKKKRMQVRVIGEKRE